MHTKILFRTDEINSTYPSQAEQIQVKSQNNCKTRTKSIVTNNRIIATIGKHIVAQQALSGGSECVGVEETASCLVVISGLQVIQSCLG